MSNNKQMLNEEQMDFLKEMMNIGAGNACTALHKMLRHPVDLIIPRVHVLSITQVPSIFDRPSLPVACVKMGMVGDVYGGVFFIMQEQYQQTLLNMVEQATPGFIRLKNINQKPDEMERSVIVEIGNIMTGVYLTAVHDFCRLNIYHTVPMLATDMVQAVLDELLAEMACRTEMSIAVENEFMIGEYPVRTFLLVIPSLESVGVLVSSIDQARQAYVSK